MARRLDPVGSRKSSVRSIAGNRKLISDVTMPVRVVARQDSANETHVVATVKCEPNVQDQSQKLSNDLAPVDQGLKEREAPSPSKRSLVSNIVNRLSYAVAAAILFVGIGTIVNGVRLNTEVETQVQALQQEDYSENSGPQIPTSKEPEGETDYREGYVVAADLPRVIRIPSVNVYARVLQVGVDDNNVMMTPTTAYDTAWYSGSSRPGEQGAMIVNGHVQGDMGPGVFGNLAKIEKGARINIEKGNGKQVGYIVTKVETIKADTLNTGSLLVSHDRTKPGLNLITCGGEYSPNDNTFESRTVVYAVAED